MHRQNAPLESDELLKGAQDLRAKVRAWQPSLILFAFKKAAEITLGSSVAPGAGAEFEGVPTFLLSGPYAGRDEADRRNAELHDTLAATLPDGNRAVMSQPVTEADLGVGIIRMPQVATKLLPAEKAGVPIVLRGTALIAKYDPKGSRDGVRSGVLQSERR